MAIIRRYALLIILAILVAGVVLLYRAASQSTDPFQRLSDFPWAYITEADMGPDETKLVIHRAGIAEPAAIVEEESGRILYRAFTHPAVPLIAGNPCIFPLITEGGSVRTPVLPGLRRRLNAMEIEQVQRYHVAEGLERIAKLRQELNK